MAPGAQKRTICSSAPEATPRSRRTCFVGLFVLVLCWWHVFVLYVFAHPRHATTPRCINPINHPKRNQPAPRWG